MMEVEEALELASIEQLVATAGMRVPAFVCSFVPVVEAADMQAAAKVFIMGDPTTCLGLGKVIEAALGTRLLSLDSRPIEEEYEGGCENDSGG